MSVRFVATEILSSADGLSHGETQVLETHEARGARGRGGKTLYEQLEAEREKQQEAYDANTKALFSSARSSTPRTAFYEAEQRRAAAAAPRAPRTAPRSCRRARRPRRRRRRPSSAAPAPARAPPPAGRHPAPARRGAGAGAEAAARRGRRPPGASSRTRPPRRTTTLYARLW